MTPAAESGQNDTAPSARVPEGVEGSEPSGGSAGSLLVVTGPPGAGKTTVARVLAGESQRGALIDGDAFFGFLRRGATPPWLPTAHEQNILVVEAAACAAGRFAAGGFATVYDGVVGPWFLPQFAAAAGLDRFDYVILLPSVERCIERIRGRIEHGFTDESAARHMHEEFAGAVEQDIEPKKVLTDPSEPVGDVVDAIRARQAAGALAYEARQD